MISGIKIYTGLLIRMKIGGTVIESLILLNDKLWQQIL